MRAPSVPCSLWSSGRAPGTGKRGDRGPHLPVLQAGDAEDSLRAVAEGPEEGHALEVRLLLRGKRPQVQTLPQWGLHSLPPLHGGHSAQLPGHGHHQEDGQVPGI